MVPIRSAVNVGEGFFLDVPYLRDSGDSKEALKQKEIPKALEILEL